MGQYFKDIQYNPTQHCSLLTNDYTQLTAICFTVACSFCTVMKLVYCKVLYVQEVVTQLKILNRTILSNLIHVT